MESGHRRPRDYSELSRRQSHFCAQVSNTRAACFCEEGWRLGRIHSAETRASQRLAIHAASTQQQIIKRQLRIVNVRFAQIAANAITRHVEPFAHRIKIKAYNAGRQTHRWDATLLSEPIHGGFAHLQY